MKSLEQERRELEKKIKQLEKTSPAITLWQEERKLAALKQKDYSTPYKAIMILSVLLIIIAGFIYITNHNLGPSTSDQGFFTFFSKMISKNDFLTGAAIGTESGETASSEINPNTASPTGFGTQGSGGGMVSAQNSPPVISSAILNSTDITTNSTNENLTLHLVVSDTDGDSIKNITNWIVNGSSITGLNMPFERINSTNSSNAYDYSGFGNIGTEGGSIVWNSTGGYDGKGAYEFDGINDGITITDDISLKPKNISVEAWVYPRAFSSWETVVIKTPSSAWTTGGYGIVHTNTLNEIRFFINSYTANFVSTTITPGSWYHLVGTYDNSNVKFYVNGALIGSDPYTAPITYGSENLLIGTAPSGIEEWDGKIDEVKIYNRSLSAEQIFALYNNRTDLIVSNETEIGDVWSVQVTPNDGTVDGTGQTSNTINILPPPPALSCGQTITQDTTLTENLVSVDDCFIIGANDITIDGAGYNISGNGSGIGFNVTGYNNIIIKNFGNLSNFTNAIYLSSSDTSTIYNNVIQPANAINSPAIYLTNSNLNNISSNNIRTYNNNNYGVQFTASTNNTIENNIIRTSGSSNGFGIYSNTDALGQNVIRSNNITTTGSLGYGMYIVSYDNLIQSNFINTTGGTGYGIYLQGTYNNTVDSNTIYTGASLGYGIFFFFNSAGNLLVNNDITSTLANEIEDQTTGVNTVIYNNSFGQINWTKADLDVNQNLVLGKTIFIENNKVGYEPGASSTNNLNATAEIELRGLSGSTTPQLLKDGVRCDNQDICNITSFSAGTLFATISSFSNYTTAEGCGIINENKVLANDISASGTCFTINASNVVLDGAGYTITGDGSTGSDGVNIEGFSNVTIKNFAGLNNFTRGIRVNNTNSSTFFNNSIEVANVTGAAAGISFSNSLDNLVDVSTITSTTVGENTVGIQLESNSINNTIKGSTITGDLVGVNVVGSSNYTNVTSSTISAQSDEVAVQLGTAYNSLHNNTILFTNGINAGRGISLTAGTNHNQLTSNNVTVSGNGSNRIGSSVRGIFLTGPVNNNSLNNNVISASGTNVHGIFLFQAINTTIDSNTITTTGINGTGILVGDTSDGNTFTSNTVTTSGSELADGISVIFAGFASYPGQNIFLNNTVSTVAAYSFNDLTNSTSANVLSYSNSFGEINWTGNLTTNISLAIGNTIFLQDNLVGLTDNAQALNLNGSAQIKITGINLPSAPELLKNGIRCDNQDICNITSFSSGVLLADISSFSNYTTSQGCGILNSSFTLNNNLTSDGTCFTINASNIVLDGAGYTITGNGSGFGVNNSVNLTNVTIKNFAGLTNFSTGIVISTINGLDNYNLTLFNNSIYNNTNNGIEFQITSYGNISFNQIYNNTNNGLLLGASDTSTTVIYNNSFNENGGNGITELVDSVDARIYNNEFNRNGANGVSFSGTDTSPIIVNNTANYNGAHGYSFNICTSGSCTFSENIGNYNTLDGVNIAGTTTEMSINNNILSYNLRSGFSITADSLAGQNYQNNIFSFNGVNGFHKFGGQMGGTWGNNTFNSNLGSGLVIEGSEALSLQNDRYYNNTIDINFTTGADGTVYTYDNIIFDNDLGTLQDYTNLSISDTINTESYTLDHATLPATLPIGSTSFANKFINITRISGTVSITSATWSWSESEITTEDESEFELWKYNGTWNLLNATPDTINNKLSISNFNSLSTFAILEVNVNSIPNISSIILNTTDLSGNSTNDNLTLYLQANDTDGDGIKNITNWLVDGVSIEILNMPFEKINSTDSNNAYDYSGYGNNGSEQGGIFWNSTLGYDGRGAYDFDGINDHINLGQMGEKFIEGSIVAWIKPLSYPDTLNTVFDLAQTGGHGLIVFVESDGDARVQWGTGAATNNAIISGVTTGAFNHIAATWNLTHGTIYLNGIGNSVASTPLVNATIATHYIGSQSGTVRFWNGTIDEVTIWNRTLTSEQILALYNNKTNLIVSQETNKNELWQACSTPNDGTEDGLERCSNTLTILNTAPTHDDPLLNATDYPLNSSSANLTVYPQNTADVDGDSINNITAWKKNSARAIAMYHAFESSTNAFNASDYAGFDQNVSSVSLSPQWLATGGFDGRGAYNFSEADESLNLATAGFPAIGSGNYTVEAWVKLNNDRQFNAIFSVNTFDPAWYVSNGNTLAVWDGSYLPCETTTDFTDDTWHHVAIVREGTGTNQVKCYVDGEVIGDLSHTAAFPTVSALRIGYDNFATDDFAGTLDEVKFWSIALTPDQVRAIYQNKTDLIVSNMTSVGDVWQAEVTPNDGTIDGITKSSNTLTILSNTPPAPPILISPPNNSTTTNRTPTMIWNNSFDQEGDNVTYNLLIDDNPTFNNPEVNVSDIAQTNPTNTTYEVTTELEVDTVYFWKVRGNDGTEFGNYSSTFNFTIQSFLAISVTNNAVNFSTGLPGQSFNTTTGIYNPFRAENIGNIISNVSLTGTQYFSATNFPSNAYEFKIRENETSAFNTTLSQLTFINMSNVTLSDHIINLDWHSFKNDFLADLRITIPSAEPPGLKNSTVTFTITG